MMKMYRLRYKDGSHGAWDSNLERIQESAKFFDAIIEERTFNFLVR